MTTGQIVVAAIGGYFAIGGGIATFVFKDIVKEVERERDLFDRLEISQRTAAIGTAIWCVTTWPWWAVSRLFGGRS